MKFDLSVSLVNYNGQLFTRAVTGLDGAPVVVEGKVKQEPLTLKGVLEAACLNADPQQHSTGVQKMLVFNLLMKIHKASPIVDFTAEEITMLKDLTGKQLTVVAVGAVHMALDKPYVGNEAATAS